MKAESKRSRPLVFRMLAWIAAFLLVAGWICLPLVFRGVGGSLPAHVFLWFHTGAFVIGLSSFGRIGGISAGLAALTLTWWLAWASGLSVG
jgi:hypothetical protein